MSVYLAEFFGTLILVLFGVGVVAGVSLNKTYSQGSGWIVITIAWGLAVTMAIYAVGRISNAHINPAVTFGLVMSGDFPANQALGYVLAQMAGGITGATLVWLHYLPHWAKTESQETKLGVFSTGPAVDKRWANLLSEIIGTTVLLFVIMLIGANEFQKGFNPIAVGALVAVIGMSLGGTTGYAINPARDLGPRIAHFILPISGKGHSNWKYSWIPVIGPLLGGSQGTLTYDFFFRGNVTGAFYIVSAINLVIIAAALHSARKES